MKQLTKKLQHDLTNVEAILWNIVTMIRDNKDREEICKEIENQAIKALKYLPEVREGQVRELIALVNNCTVEEVVNKMPHLKDSPVLTNGKLYPTRYLNLFYRREAPGQWSFYHNNGDCYASIGGKYKSQIEICGDIENFAETRGFEINI